MDQLLSAPQQMANTKQNVMEKFKLKHFFNFCMKETIENGAEEKIQRG